MVLLKPSGILFVTCSKKKKLAEILSVLLGPQSWLPILLIAFLFKTGLTTQQKLILFPMILILQVIIPLLYLYMAPKLRWAEAWDLPNQEERFPFFVLILVANLISLITIYFLGTKLLFFLVSLLFTLMIITMIITYFWKLSLHISLNTFGAIMVNFLFGWEFPIIYLSIPIIFWARLTLGRHSIFQLIAPIILNIVFIFSAFYLFGYLK